MRLLLLCLVAMCTSPAPAPPADPVSPGSVSEAPASPSVPTDSVVTVRGIFHTGFEASWIRPCGAEGDAWALRPDSSFHQLYSEIERQHVPTRRRGTNIYVETMITGVLRTGGPGPYGHVSACHGPDDGCTGEIRVTETHSMTFLTVDPDEPPTCR